MSGSDLMAAARLLMTCHVTGRQLRPPADTSRGTRWPAAAGFMGWFLSSAPTGDLRPVPSALAPEDRCGAERAGCVCPAHGSWGPRPPPCHCVSSSEGRSRDCRRQRGWSRRNNVLPFSERVTRMRGPQPATRRTPRRPSFWLELPVSNFEASPDEGGATATVRLSWA